MHPLRRAIRAGQGPQYNLAIETLRQLAIRTGGDVEAIAKAVGLARSTVDGLYTAAGLRDFLRNQRLVSRHPFRAGCMAGTNHGELDERWRLRQGSVDGKKS